MQMIRLNASNILMRSIMINNLIGNSEAEAGLIANSLEEAEAEDDDG